MALVQLTNILPLDKLGRSSSTGSSSNGGSEPNAPSSNPHSASAPRQSRNAGSPTLLHEGTVLLAGAKTFDLQAAERFRILRAKIERHNLGPDPKHIIAVTSAVPEEGKSLTAVNLSRALAMDPHGKTLVIDCDLRRPNVHRYFGLPIGPGLSDALIAGRPLDNVIQSVEPGLDVITAGSPVIDAARTLELPGMVRFLADFKRRYRYVILDCPPVVLCPEPITISSLADATMMVVRAWKTQKKLVKDAVNLIGKEKFLGLILNDGNDSLNECGYYGYYAYENKSAKARLAAAQALSNPRRKLFSMPFGRNKSAA